jgi:hypothetical protein
MKLNDVTRGTGLDEHGITNANLIYWTPITPFFMNGSSGAAKG